MNFWFVVFCFCFFWLQCSKSLPIISLWACDSLWLLIVPELRCFSIILVILNIFFKERLDIVSSIWCLLKHSVYLWLLILLLGLMFSFLGFLIPILLVINFMVSNSSKDFLASFIGLEVTDLLHRYLVSFLIADVPIIYSVHRFFYLK